MTQELSVYVTPEGTPMGLEGFTPKATIGQLKRDNDTGEIEYTQNGERKEEWDVIFTNAWYERALFTGGFGEGSKPDCRSTNKSLNEDALVGDVYGDCFKCANADWGPKDPSTGKGTPPKCGLTLAFAGFLDSGRTQPFIVRFRGKALKEARTILQRHYDTGRALFELSYKIKLGEVQKNGAVKWRDWIIETGVDLKEANEALVADLAAEYVQHSQNFNNLLPGQDSAEDLAAGVTAEEVAEALGGTIVDDKEMPADFLATTPKVETQEEQVKSGKIPFAS